MESALQRAAFALPSLHRLGEPCPTLATVGPVNAPDPAADDREAYFAALRKNLPPAAPGDAVDGERAAWRSALNDVLSIEEDPGRRHLSVLELFRVVEMHTALTTLLELRPRADVSSLLALVDLPVLQYLEARDKLQPRTLLQTMLVDAGDSLLRAMASYWSFLRERLEHFRRIEVVARAESYAGPSSDAAQAVLGAREYPPEGFWPATRDAAERWTRAYEAANAAFRAAEAEGRAIDVLQQLLPARSALIELSDVFTALGVDAPGAVRFYDMWRLAETYERAMELLREQRKELQARDNVEDARVLREAGDAASQLMRRISQVWARVHLAWRDAYRQSQERAAAAAAERSRQSLVNPDEIEGVN